MRASLLSHPYSLFPFVLASILPACAHQSPLHARGNLPSSHLAHADAHNAGYQPLPQAPTLLCPRHREIRFCHQLCHCNSTLHVTCSSPPLPPAEAGKQPRLGEVSTTSTPKMTMDSEGAYEEHCAHSCACTKDGVRYWYGIPMEEWAAKQRDWGLKTIQEWQKANPGDGHPLGLLKWAEERKGARKGSRGNEGS